MDDIVTRLKDVLNCLTVEEQQDIVDDAADEIERLRAEEAETFIMYRKTIEECDVLEAEIERLRGLLWKYEHCEMVTESPCDVDWDGGECAICDNHRKGGAW